MVSFITGPKQLLANAITNALDEYFMVDASLIESTLLGPEKKIALHKVQVRPKTATIVDKNAGGTASVLSVTGGVDLVEFSWDWSSGGKSFVKDAKLTIQGMDIIGDLSKVDIHEEAQTLETPDILPNEDQIQDAATKTDIKNQGGIKAYVMRQVEIMIDSLTLHIKDFKCTLKTPNNEGGTTSIVLGGESIQLLSFGREEDAITKEMSAYIRQTMSIDGLYISILDNPTTTTNADDTNNNSQATIIEPILEPFSYNAQVVRQGKRFASPFRGLTVTGESGADSGGIVLHAGHAQLHAFSQFSLMLLKAKDDNDDKVENKPVLKESESTGSDVGLEDLPPPTPEDLSQKPSEFNISSHSMALNISDGMKFNFTRVGASYVADGSIAALKAEAFTLKQEVEGQEEPIHMAQVEGILVTQTPNLVVQLDKLSTLEVPNTLQLLSPSEDIRVEFEGKTMKLRVNTFELKFLEDNSSNKEDSDKKEQEEKIKPKDRINTQAPFPIQITVGQMGMQSGDDVGSRSQCKGLELFLNPGDQGTEFAAVVKELDNKLVHITDSMVCGTQPIKGAHEIQNLKVAVDSITVYGGHSTNEWIDTLQLIGDKEKTKAIMKDTKTKDRKDNENLWIMPHCHVEPLKVHITYKGAVGVKDVKFKTDSFVGKENTTGKDIAFHYVAICLKNVPGFITNSEVLGVSVMDMGVGTYLGMATPLGAAGSVAAMAAIDSVKGAVSAGKKSRKADQEDQAVFTDFFRGIGYAAVDATQRGALKRGKKESDNLGVLDWVQGVTDDTGKYVGDNKARLGGAGGAGAGMLVGTLLGGPVGGIIGGVLGGATTQKTIEKIENKS